MSGQTESDYLSTWASLLELFVHHSPKNMESERETARLGVSAVPWWGQKHMIQEAREGFEKRKQCVSNETPTCFSRTLHWQCQSAMGCSAGSLKTGKPGCKWQMLHLLSSTSFQRKQAPRCWRGLLLVAPTYPIVVSPILRSIEYYLGYMPAPASAHSSYYKSLLKTPSILVQSGFHCLRLQRHQHHAHPPKCIQLSSLLNALGIWRTNRETGYLCRQPNFSSQR